MKLQMNIHNIKSIDNLEINLPLDKGLYAITGQNGSGKSTVATCAASVFYFNMPMHTYFGKTGPDSSITFRLGNLTTSWTKKDGNWWRTKIGNIKINGFYEGSLIFGTRFRNTNYGQLKKLDKIANQELLVAPDFIRKNMGHILHNDESYYDKLFVLNKKKEEGFFGDVFYYQKNDRRVSQFYMSTGENLLIGILNSIYLKNSDRSNTNVTSLMLLDEIELALHPSSLKRLIRFLSDLSIQYNYAIYFATHSIELISSIVPDNIFYLERYADNSINIINPCFPAYATKFLYDHTGYDCVILVEDNLAREIVKRILRNYRMLDSKLIHVLPCGGYSNVIVLAHDVVKNNLLGKTSSVCMILDGDIKDDAEVFMQKNNISANIPLGYLPIKSLEKFLLENLCISVDHKLYKLLNDYVFQSVSLADIIQEYKKCNSLDSDKSGKKLFNLIDSELRNRNHTQEELIEIIVDYLIKEKEDSLLKIKKFLKNQLGE